MMRQHQSRSKVYTEEEEVAVLNFLLQRRLVEANNVENENEAINVSAQDRVITIEWLDGSQHECKINWLQQLEGDYFLAGLTYVNIFSGSRSDMHTEWVLKIDKEAGFIPMFCSLYWKED
jgi:hypothetical protein